MKIFAALLMLTACAGSSATDNSDPPPLLKQLPRTLSAAEQQLITAGNAFAFDLFRRAQAADPGGNLFLSPTSAGMALAMTMNGAATGTLTAMQTALRVPGAPIEEINAGYRSLIDLLRGLDSQVDFKIANSIWAHTGVSFAPEFLSAGKTSFDAEIQSRDFAAGSTLTAINDWVREKTGGKIPTILDQVAREEVMFLINAIYFKGNWRVPFDPARTQSLPFHAADGSVGDAPMMRLEPTPVLRGSGADGEQIVELLYGNGAYAMTLVLPQEGSTLVDLGRGLDPARWAEWTGRLAEGKIGLVLPKFTLSYTRALSDDLSEMGMGIAFDPNQADFSKMRSGGQRDLYLTRVVQKTFVDVNEKGTTAAAATAVGVGLTSMPETVSFDRPFLFAIRERLSGTILFVGQVGKL